MLKCTACKEGLKECKKMITGSPELTLCSGCLEQMFVALLPDDFARQPAHVVFSGFDSTGTVAELIEALVAKAEEIDRLEG